MKSFMAERHLAEIDADISADWKVDISLGQKKKNLDLGFALHRAVLYRYQDPPKKISNL